MTSAVSHVTGLKVELFDQALKIPLVQGHPVVFGKNFCYAALLRPPMEIKRLFFHFKTSYNKTDASVFNLTDI